MVATDSYILRCDQLTKTFGGDIALNNVSIKLPHSRIVALVGPNGAGKTTLLNLITGVMRPNEGQIFLAGHKLTTLRIDQIARLGIARTFQDVRLVSVLSVLENVLLASPTRIYESIMYALFS